MISVDDYKVLRKCKPFENLTIEQFDKLASQMTYRKIPKNQILFFEGDKRDKLYFIKSGYAKIEQYDEEDIFLYVDFVKENSLFPYGGLFQDDTYRYTAKALTDMEIFYVPVVVFEAVCRENSEQLLFICKKLSNVLKLHELKLRNMLNSSAAVRVEQTLSILYYDLAKDNHAMPFDIPVVEIARMSAVTRETAGQVIKKLKDKGVIDYRHKKLTFLNTDFFHKNVE